MSTPRHSALVRNDNGGLEVRYFPTAKDAAKVASAERELVAHAPRGSGILSSKLARQLGVHPKTIRRRWARGQIPGIEHGERTLVIPYDAARLIKIYGLLGYARMREAGQL